MDLLTTLVLLAMLFNLLENTFVAVVAVLIYLRQKDAMAKMEERINKGIADVTNRMKSDEILGALKKAIIKDIKKTINGWFGGKKGGANRAVTSAAKEIGATRAILKDLNATKDPMEKALILGEYAAEKFTKYNEAQEAKKAQEAAAKEEEEGDILTVDDYKKANMSPEEYQKIYLDGLKTVEGRVIEG